MSAVSSPIPAVLRQPALSVAGIRLTYPARRRRAGLEALRGVELTIEAGQAVALLGPNGSGKSTLIRIICGVLPPDSGAVAVFGATSPSAIRPLISVVFQTPGLDRHLTVLENLRDQAALYGLRSEEAQRRSDQELRRGGVDDRRHSLVKTLSTGLARRVDLCRAMLHRPRLLMLDEPTVGLDPVARESFLRSLEERRLTEGLTILMSTHLVDEADRCDRVILLHRGRVVADDAPAALRRRLGTWRVTTLGADVQPPGGAGPKWERVGGGWSAPLDGSNAETQRIAAALAAAGIAFSMGPPTLADVFEALTGDQLHVDDRESRTREATAR